MFKFLTKKKRETYTLGTSWIAPVKQDPIECFAVLEETETGKRYCIRFEVIEHYIIHPNGRNIEIFTIYKREIRVRASFSSVENFESHYKRWLRYHWEREQIRGSVIWSSEDGEFV